MNLDFKYNFLIIGTPGYYQVGYKDVMTLKNVNYYLNHWDGTDGFAGKIVRMTFSNKINKYVKHPFSRFSYPRVFKTHFADNRPICVIFFSSNYYLVNSPYLHYLKNTHPNCKIVFYYQDKVKVHTPNIDINELKKKVDVIYSYDKHDCADYSLKYYPTPYSSINVPVSHDLPDSDVFYCGRAKTRFDIIHNIYKRLTDQGLKCDFILNSFPETSPRIDGIKYNHYISYERYLQHVSHTKIILEIMQEDTDGFTPRLWESIAFEKLLLTNNPEVKLSRYYNSHYMHNLEVLDDIRELLNTKVNYTQDEKEQLSPINFLHEVESNFI